MKNTFSNMSYFLKETGTMMRLNFISNVLSLLSIGIVFFFLNFIISGWWISSHLVQVIQQEAAINVYFDESLEEKGILQLSEKIREISGVEESRVISQNEAYNRMEKILGDEASVLGILEENPFTSFIEVNISLDKIDYVLNELKQIKGIEHVRNNRDILDRLNSMITIARLLGLLILIAVGIATLVIVSHLIRMGVYNNRDKINTLRLLGAPEIFIALPYLLEGLLLTLGGGILAILATAFVLKLGYMQVAGSLPFIPLPSYFTLVSAGTASVLCFSIILGLGGSLLGLSSEKRK